VSLRSTPKGVAAGKNVFIPMDEIELKFSPSGGPGGQHANRSSTRVDLSWNVETTRALSDRHRQLVKGRLRHRIDSSGNLKLSSDAHRSQLQNRREVLRRLGALVEEALKVTRRRVATTATTAARERRLSEKRRRSEVKRLRRTPDD
jgi:ribosome-associated protein